MVTTGKTPDGTPPLLAVRATVNLSGLAAGAEALVDPGLPYIQECLKAEYLVALPDPEQAGATDG